MCRACKAVRKTVFLLVLRQIVLFFLCLRVERGLTHTDRVVRRCLDGHGVIVGVYSERCQIT